MSRKHSIYVWLFRFVIVGCEEHWLAALRAREWSMLQGLEIGACKISEELY